MTREALLEVNGLRKHFGGVKAVDGCSFHVPKGAVVGLIGPNGAGKSTAIDLVSGFHRPDGGSVVFAGEELVGRSAHDISRLGLIRTFQSPKEWPALTVFDNLMLAARRYRREGIWRSLFTYRAVRRAEQDDRILVRHTAAQFGLDHVLNEQAGNLSGGQKQLVEFGRIAIAKPAMIILDEPMGGVNPVLGERIHQAVRDFVADGSTVLIVEHNLTFIEQTCDEVVVMDLGQVIAQGPYASLLGDQRVVDAYLGAADLEVEVEEVENGA